MSWRPGEPRFVVREIEGYVIKPGPWIYGGNTKPALSISVLDAAYNFEEVARFNEEDIKPRQWHAGRKREALRNRAAGLAAILEAEHAT